MKVATVEVKGEYVGDLHVRQIFSKKLKGEVRYYVSFQKACCSLFYNNAYNKAGCKRKGISRTIAAFIVKNYNQRNK